MTTETPATTAQPSTTATTAVSTTTSAPATTAWAPESEPAGPAVIFEARFGGDANDRGVSVIETDDGGYAVAGVTTGSEPDDEDVYLVRVDQTGEEIWSRSYGGPGMDSGWSVQQTDHGGFIIAGFTTSFGAGENDVYLLRTDPSGELLWETTLGGPGDDYGWWIEPVTGGGYIIAAETESFGAGEIDAYLIRVDDDGEELWSKTYGGEEDDRAFSVKQTSDGGFVVAGITFSFDVDDRDAYVFRTDSDGELQWERTFGGPGDDVAHSIDITDDGGSIAMGYTDSFDAQGEDVYLIKLDQTGETEWTQVFGGEADDRIITGQQTTDGGYFLVGFTNSFGAGDLDVYLVKTDPTGTEEWTTTFGGPRGDTGYTVQQTTTGDYILTGSTRDTETGARDAILIEAESD